MLRILIADDHAVVRGGLRQFLADAGDCGIAGEAATGAETIERVQAEPWDMLLLDIGLPDLNGLEVLKIVRRSRPAMPVLVFSMLAEDDYALIALQAGAAGYLPKDSEPKVILEAIRRVGRGERYVSPELTEKLLAGTASAGRRLPHNLLSPREFEVLRLLSRGLALTTIATTLHLSPKTVSTYRTRILDKLDLGSNAELTRYVVEYKLDAGRAPTA
jgi:DNA-binding NarL/FixJ family response regulator